MSKKTYHEKTMKAVEKAKESAKQDKIDVVLDNVVQAAKMMKKDLKKIEKENIDFLESHKKMNSL